MSARPHAAAGPHVGARPDLGGEDAADRAAATQEAATRAAATREAATREAVRLLGLLAQPDRLRAAAALVLGATSTPEVAKATGMTVRAAAQALALLAAGGLAETRGPRWELRAERLGEAVRAAAPDAGADDHGAAEPGTAAVLRNFLRNGRITAFPTARAKRRVLLDHVARTFEPGVRYPEREVNALLRAFHADYAALRRYLVDEEFLDREGGIYWRTGGTVEL